eukprot:m.229586 g.229586  ORF g.229586 m.229586 type:complete len:450 (+) comp11925_c0_seq1:1268-2617(+)
MGLTRDVVTAITQQLPGKGFFGAEAGRLHNAVQDIATAATAVLSNRVVLYALGGFALYRVGSVLFGPVRHIRRNEDVGYLLEECQTKAERANEVRRRRQTGDLPPVYPNGWFCIMPAHEVAKNEVKQAHILGLDLAVFRTESGAVSVVEAYCPHLGANLAAGGHVHGETLACPFHGWEFDCDGKCVRIPYAKDPTKVPSEARVKKYTSLEINDQILFWFDAEGREPFWYPPELTGIRTGNWIFRGKTQHFLNSHIQEVPENAADVAHLNYLHGPILLNGTDLRFSHSRFKFMRHDWEASWAPNTAPGEEHLSTLNLVHRIYIFGIHFPLVDFFVKATQIGPGLVYLTWESIFGSGVFVQALTPQEPLLQNLTHCIYAQRMVPIFIAKFYMIGEALQVERDVMVWNNKMYRGKPMLVAEDSLIAQHRRWYKQFYSENSPRYSAAHDGANW